jgi:hypothetical protein
LARWQAPTSDRIANLCHAPVVLENASGRHLLTLLDGTRDRAALLREMRPFIDADRKAQQLDKDQTPAVLSDNELARNLESTLEVFARYALLMG